MGEQQEEFVARAYQVDLYEKAVKGNTIIYLPTGAGKTYIAVMLVKKFSNDLLKPYSEGGKRTIFAVNTVSLVEQQSKYLARHTGLTCAGYSGDMHVDFWDQEKWTEEVEKYQILVMTSQIFVDILNHGYIPLSRVNLMIFDECHRGVNDHPMRQIMKRFETCPVDEQPRVLALTATLLNSNVKLPRVNDTIQTLETTFHATIAAMESISAVKGYSTNPQEKVTLFKPPSYFPVLDGVLVILDEAKAVVSLVDLTKNLWLNESSDVFKPKSKNNKLKNILDDVIEHLNMTGLYGGSKAALLHMIQLESLRKSSDDQQTMMTLGYLVTQLTKVRKMLEDEMKDSTDVARIYKYSADQVLKLFAVLKDFNDNKLSAQKFCCIVFVKRRFTAKVLYHILENLRTADERFSFLLPEFMVGFSNDPYKNAREVLCIAKWNKRVLHKFKNGQSNCIVATDVVDEGLDVPNCTLVVRFDLPADFRSYIQSKGRARHATSRYALLIPSNDQRFLQRHKEYQMIEQHLQGILVGKSDIREQPSLEQIKEELYDSLIEPYVIHHPSGEISVMTGLSAISIINRYCSLLISSKFSSLAPIWRLKKITDLGGENMFKVTLTMPSVSPLKTAIHGDPMPNVKLAKRSAAYKCCIELHKIGELTDHLLPKEVSAVLEDVAYLYPKWVKEEVVENAIPGTYAKKRQHKLVSPECLYAAFPREGVGLYLHIMDAKPSYSVPQDNRRLVFYNLLADTAGYAILSTKPLPELSAFSLFMNVGELSVEVRVNHATLTLTAEQIERLRIFHTMIFSQVLNVMKPFMLFDRDNLDNSFMVVPVDHKWEINWSVVTQYECITYIEPPKPIHVSAKDYELALVMPSYRASANVYVVTQICEDLMADSSFPTTDFYSYVHYFSDRHGLHIQEGKQPMLEVKPISTKINCIKPRGIKAGMSKRKRADLCEDFEEHLVPELCRRVNFPALYWLKATILPSLLHRITQLLTAEQLRLAIQREANFKASRSLPKILAPLIVTEKEVDEVTEPLLELTLDETIPEISQPEPELSGPEFDVLDLESRMYSWTKEQEPPDMQRTVEQIQLIDIEYYMYFLSLSTEEDTTTLQNRKMVPGYMDKPSVPVVPLGILTANDMDGPSQVDIMQALTTKLGNDVMNLERLETLGDSFLKYFITLFLYETFPLYNEGQLTSIKGKMIGNRNLYYCGNDKNIPGRMKVDDFVPNSNFIAPAYTVLRQLQQVLLTAEVSPNILYEFSISLEERMAGSITQATLNQIQQKVLAWDGTDSQSDLEHFLGVQTVPDKAVADSVEALIGVYLKSMGLEGAAKILMWFGILPEDTSIEKHLFSCSSNPRFGNGDPNILMSWADTIESRLGYKFNDRAYLLQAFTHPSFTPNGITACYQRLEFLGDAVLDFLITVHIYETCGNLNPGELTDLRSALVNNITFACLAVRYGLHTCLLAYAPQLNEIIDRFVKFQEDRNHSVDDELLWVLLEENECNMAEYVDVPKILGDLFESLAGAIYMDSGKKLAKVWEIFYALMHKEIDAFSKNVPKQPVRVIYETQGARPKFSTAKLVEGSNRVMVPLEVTIAGKQQLFHGFGANKKQAKCAAAKQALKNLRCKQ